jgi:threonine dehydratase
VSQPPVTLAAIRATRERLGDRIHHTPLLSSATAARFAGQAAGVRLADGRLYLKAEHLQKTGSFKPAPAPASGAPSPGGRMPARGGTPVASCA